MLKTDFYFTLMTMYSSVVKTLQANVALFSLLLSTNDLRSIVQPRSSQMSSCKHAIVLPGLFLKVICKMHP